MNKLWRLQVLKLPSLFITISFDVITFDLPQIWCNVQPPNNTSKKIRLIVFSVISVYEENKDEVLAEQQKLGRKLRASG